MVYNKIQIQIHKYYSAFFSDASFYFILILGVKNTFYTFDRE